MHAEQFVNGVMQVVTLVCSALLVPGGIYIAWLEWTYGGTARERIVSKCCAVAVFALTILNLAILILALRACFGAES